MTVNPDPATAKEKAKPNPFESAADTAAAVCLGVAAFIGFVYTSISVVHLSDTDTDFFLRRYSIASFDHLNSMISGSHSLIEITILPLKIGFAMSWALATTLLWPATIALGAVLFGIVGCFWAVIVYGIIKGIGNLSSQSDHSEKQLKAE